MMRDRGYTVSDNTMNQSFEDFVAQFKNREALNMLFQKPSDPKSENVLKPLDMIDLEQKILVYYPEEDKVGASYIKKIALKMCDLQVTNAVVILKNSTNLAKKEIESLKPCILELFTQDELMYNITHHDLVPKHQILPLEKRAELLLKYKIKEHQLPKILCSDPVARYLGVRKG